jgi:hypothetical protein
MTKDEKAKVGETLAALLGRYFVGVDADIVGAALADLTAIWLAGHCVENDGLATAKFRDEIHRLHIKTIHRLVKLNAKMMGTDY